MNEIRFDGVVPQVFAAADIVSDVWAKSIAFERGKVCLVEAESGKGKSTFCSYVMGYRRDYEGQIFFDNRKAKSLRVADWTALRQTHLSYLFQELRLFPELTALENVEIKNKLTGFKERRQIVEWFERLGIGDKQQAKVGRMSFGQQQRVAMIRALVQPFDFLLVDEPISHLDDRNSQIMADIMLNEAQAQGAGVIVTSIGKHMELEYDKTFKL